MRIVLDTNVVISALIWGGAPFRLLQEAIENDIALYTSPALLNELRKVLAREHLAKRLVNQQTTLEEVIRLYDESSISITPLRTPRAVPGDIDDDQVVACALAAQADLIVSGDADLLSMQEYEGIRIVDVTTAITLIE